MLIMRVHTVHENESVHGMLRHFVVKIIKINLTEKANFAKVEIEDCQFCHSVTRRSVSRCYAA